MAYIPITSWQIDGETMETVRDIIFLGSKITADGDCSREINRRLLLGRKAMTNLVVVVQLPSHGQLFVTPWTAECQVLLSLPSPKVCPSFCPLNLCCHPTISSSVTLFSFCLQSFPASGSFQWVSSLPSGGHSIGVSALASVFPVNIQGWFPLGWTGWISLQSKGLSRIFSNIRVQNHQFFGAQLSSQSNSHIHTWLLEKPWLWLDGPLLVK